GCCWLAVVPRRRVRHCSAVSCRSRPWATRSRNRSLRSRKRSATDGAKADIGLLEEQLRLKSGRPAKSAIGAIETFRRSELAYGMFVRHREQARSYGSR